MKKLMIVALFTIVGCAHNVEPPNTAHNISDRDIEPNTAHNISDRNIEGNRGDIFDKAGAYGADGGRWVWNKTTKAYEWFTSDENMERYHNAWNAAKKAVKSGYDYVHNVYENCKRHP
jgi:hypothetical protein